MISRDHPTVACIHLGRMTRNVRLLQSLVGERPMWPAIKANAYGHGLELVASHLLGLGYDTLCLAHVSEAVHLIEAGVQARFVLLSASLPEQAELIVDTGCEAAVCSTEMMAALGRAAGRAGKRIPIHLMVDTGMGRIGIPPQEVPAFIAQCSAFPSLQLRGLMSHFPCADEADKRLSLEQIEDFSQLIGTVGRQGDMLCHMANSAAVFDLPGSHFDAVRPGISIYGLAPSAEITNPRVKELQPVLEWKSRISFLKEVPTGTGLSYGHAFHTKRPSFIATLPVGYGDGLDRRLSNNMDVLIQGVRCPQVGRITMDQCLVDVTALRGRIRLGDEVVIIGQQGSAAISADELAARLDTINYEIVTRIGERVPRVAVTGEDADTC